VRECEGERLFEGEDGGRAFGGCLERESGEDSTPGDARGLEALRDNREVEGGDEGGTQVGPAGEWGAHFVGDWGLLDCSLDERGGDGGRGDCEVVVVSKG